MSSTYRFGDCELHVAERRLSIGGKPAPLGGRAFEVLRVLVEQRARPVPKDELLDTVWPGQFVEEGNLPVQVSSLRKLLGPQAISTVPGRGYRFSLPVQGDDIRIDPPGAAAIGTAAAAAPEPPLRSNLPLPTTALLGRDDDLAQLQAALAQAPLTTVVGSSGIGKTRLALAAAQALALSLSKSTAPSNPAPFEDGVWWVDLAESLDPDLLVGRIAQALGLEIERASDPAAALIEGLRKLRMLVVLDNCEHLLDRLAPLVQAALDTAPQVRWLLTSQEPLKLAAERVLRLAPLAVPAAGTPLAEALQSGAMALLVQRARAADRRFTLTPAHTALAIEICRQLDGLPLALEMAAARLPWMGVQAVHDRLGERLRMLRDDLRVGSARHRTLLAAMDWSHGLLSAIEQAVFRRLAVFRGGFTLHTAPAVVADGEAVGPWEAIDALGALVDKSLIQIDGDPQAGELRYRMLESARLFAQERLAASGEGGAVRERHAQAMAVFAQQWSERMWTEPDAVWLAATAPEADNLRVALDTALGTALGTAPDAARHAGPALHTAAAQAAPVFDLLSWIAFRLHGGAEVWHVASRVQALVDAVDAVEVAADSAADPQVAIRLHMILGGAWRNAAPARALAIWRDTLARLGPDADRVVRYRLASGVAMMAARTGRAEEAAANWRDARALLDPAWPLRLQMLEAHAAAFVAHFSGDAAAARGHYARFRTLALQAGAEGGLMVVSLNLADIALSLGEVEEAAGIGRELVAWLRRTPRSPFNLGLALGIVFAALVQQGELAAALEAGTEALAMLRRDELAVWLFDHFALLAVRQGALADAARLLGYADKAREASSAPRDRAELHACALARAAVDAALDAPLREKLAAEGAALGDAEADALATAPRA